MGTREKSLKIIMKSSAKKVGILAFQGDVLEHTNLLQKLGFQTLEVRTPQDLENCNALIIPGGESTTIGLFLEQTGLNKKIIQRAGKGLPILGTCAGAIVMAKNVTGNVIPPHLGLIDMTIQRNAYGAQIDSFHADIDIPACAIEDLQAAFIRAPIIQKVGPKVEVLARHGQEIVLVRQNNLWAATFHPELRGDPRLHTKFLTQL